MNKIKIFLASSIVEFKSIRNKIGEYVLEYNNEYIEKGKKIKLFECEFHDEAISPLDRKQDEYMEVLKKSDIFLMLIGKKLGNYTKEEYQVALDNNIERHIIFFKTNEEDNTVIEFKKHLRKIKESNTYEVTTIDEIKNILYKIVNK